MKYNKQPLDIPALLAMLKARGLVIGDEQQAERILGFVSYFRLANYPRDSAIRASTMALAARKVNKLIVYHVPCWECGTWCLLSAP